MTHHDPQPRPPQTLRLLSFNMQVGIGTKRYREYITRGWRNLLPSLQVQENLGRIATLIADYDIVGIQEADAGSRRSSYQNQIEWLADRAGFAYWRVLVNRDLGHFAQHGVGLLSRHTPFAISEHALPGALPGRGALRALFGSRQEPLAVVVTHLALTRGSRRQQLAAVRALIEDFPHALVMADTNCSPSRLRANPALADGRLCIVPQRLPTFPSWRPRRCLDHILTTAELTVRDVHVPDVRLSDHRPVAMTVGLPPSLQQRWAAACDPRDPSAAPW
ncbi:MAG: endonuclease/exonuclease/phosphatase family protein [Salinisphaera sp.]|nr:endonuclease/exonuclease/phosphatase family protein [Salinisphaera sp.]